jgi:hypothetical protein
MTAHPYSFPLRHQPVGEREVEAVRGFTAKDQEAFRSNDVDVATQEDVLNMLRSAIECSNRRRQAR